MDWNCVLCCYYLSFSLLLIKHITEDIKYCTLFRTSSICTFMLTLCRKRIFVIWSCGSFSIIVHAHCASVWPILVCPCSRWKRVCLCHKIRWRSLPQVTVIAKARMTSRLTWWREVVEIWFRARGQRWNVFIMSYTSTSNTDVTLIIVVFFSIGGCIRMNARCYDGEWWLLTWWRCWHRRSIVYRITQGTLMSETEKADIKHCKRYNTYIALYGKVTHKTHKCVKYSQQKVILNSNKDQ